MRERGKDDDPFAGESVEPKSVPGGGEDLSLEEESFDAAVERGDVILEPGLIELSLLDEGEEIILVEAEPERGETEDPGYSVASTDYLVVVETESLDLPVESEDESASVVEDDFDEDMSEFGQTEDPGPSMSSEDEE